MHLKPSRLGCEAGVRSAVALRAVRGIVGTLPQRTPSLGRAPVFSAAAAPGAPAPRRASSAAA